MEEFKQMARKKTPRPGEELAKEIIEKYKPKTVEDMQNALKDIFGPMFEAMLNGEMDHHWATALMTMVQKIPRTGVTDISKRLSGQAGET